MTPVAQGGELSIKLDDGTTLKARVREVEINSEVNHDTINSLWSNASMEYVTDERYTLTAEFDGAYTIYKTPAAAHKVRVVTADSSIKGIMAAQRVAGAPSTAEIKVYPSDADKTLFNISFTWEA